MQWWITAQTYNLFLPLSRVKTPDFIFRKKNGVQRAIGVLRIFTAVVSAAEKMNHKSKAKTNQ